MFVQRGRMTAPNQSEIQVVISCVKAALRGETRDFPIIRNTDLDFFQRLADWHKVLPLVERALTSEADTREHGFLRAERNLEWLRRVCERLESTQIPVLPLRGLLLAQSLYGDFHRRASADVDLLVPPEHAERAMWTLASMGLQPPFPPDPARFRACARFRGECAFLQVADRAAVDLHWQSVPRCFQIIPDEQMWKESERMELAGYIFRAPRPAHQLLHLCAHGTKHGWDRLIYMADFAAACLRFSEAEIAVAEREAKQSGKEEMWLLAKALARELFGVTTPSSTTEPPLPPHVRRALRRILENLQSGAAGARGGRERRILRHVLRNSADRWMYWWDIAGVPTAIELAAVRLPAALWWGYAPLRWMRLAARAIRFRSRVGG